MVSPHENPREPAVVPSGHAVDFVVARIADDPDNGRLNVFPGTKTSVMNIVEKIRQDRPANAIIDCAMSDSGLSPAADHGKVTSRLGMDTDMQSFIAADPVLAKGRVKDEFRAGENRHMFYPGNPGAGQVAHAENSHTIGDIINGKSRGFRSTSPSSTATTTAPRKKND